MHCILFTMHWKTGELRVESESKSEMEMETLVQAAKDGAEKTRDLESRAGRARYVQGKGVGKIDPGAFAVYLLLRALL